METITVLWENGTSATYSKKMAREIKQDEACVHIMDDSTGEIIYYRGVK